MRGKYRFRKTPAPLQRAKLDNLALVPGNLLPYKEAWQAIANRLPHRAVLIILPPGNSSQKQTMLSVAKMLSEAGHQVRVIPAKEVR